MASQAHSCLCTPKTGSVYWRTAEALVHFLTAVSSLATPYDQTSTGGNVARWEASEWLQLFAA